MPEQPVILLANDSEEDILLIRKALTRAIVSNPLQVLRDREEYIAYLGGTSQFADRAKY